MNEITVKGLDLSEICRLCLTKDTTLLDIFYFSDEISNQLSNVIMTFAPVQIKRHDEMPNSICHVCYSQLKNNHKFQVQIVQSDKTLRQYLQQQHYTSGQQIKSEFSIQNSSEEHLTQESNHPDVTEKSIVFHNIFGMNHTMNEMAPLSYNVVKEPNEEMPLKLEIKDEPMDDNSFNQTECVNNTEDTLSKGDEFVFQDSKVNNSYYTEMFEKVDIIGKEENFKSLNKIDESVPLKFEIKDEPTDDNYLYSTECADETVETLYKTDDSEICSENSKISVKSESLGKSEDSKKDIAANYENRKKVIDKKFICDICNKCFCQINSLNNHRRKHTGEKPYQCDVCNMCFSRSDALNYHKRAHTGEKPYQCDVCNMCFSRSDTLNHHKRTHTGEKPYQCNVCNKNFSHANNLNMHKRTHTGVKPYRCDFCKMRFSRSDALNRHKRIHTGEKPYQCDVCNKNFAISTHLTIHKRTHTGEKPYQCDVCNKNFSMSSHLITHKRKHAEEKPNKCDVSNGGLSQTRDFDIDRRTYSSKKSQE